MKKQTVKNLIRELKLVLKEHGDLPVVTSSDDEGNAFNAVFYSPTLMENMELDNCQGEKLDKCICLN